MGHGFDPNPLDLMRIKGLMSNQMGLGGPL